VEAAIAAETGQNHRSAGRRRWCGAGARQSDSRSWTGTFHMGTRLPVRRALVDTRPPVRRALHMVDRRTITVAPGTDNRRIVCVPRNTHRRVCCKSFIASGA
jgi:hypothetical protein